MHEFNSGDFFFDGNTVWSENGVYFVLLDTPYKETCSLYVDVYRQALGGLYNQHKITLFVSEDDCGVQRLLLGIDPDSLFEIGEFVESLNLLISSYSKSQKCLEFRKVVQQVSNN